ncbi:MAG: protein kinase, partial [Mycobacterium sp.]
VNDYGEPQLTDFGTAHIEGGYETGVGFFSGTIDYTAPEVMTGSPATVGADIYSLGATIYALIAGNAAHERRSGEDLLAHYMRVSTTRVSDLRPDGIPDAVCSAIENAMALDPAERPASAAEFGRWLQAGQRRNGFKPDSMAITAVGCGSGRTVVTSPGVFEAPSVSPGGHSGKMQPPVPRPSSIARPSRQIADQTSATSAINPPNDPRKASPLPQSRPAGRQESFPAPTIAVRPYSMETRAQAPPTPGSSEPTQSIADQTSATSAIKPRSYPGPRPVTPSGKKRNRKTSPLIATAAVMVVLLVVLLVISGVYLVLSHGNNHKVAASQPSTQAPVKWQPITNARIARDAVATTQADGTIWIFGGIGSDGAVIANHEGYDPVIDTWKSGDDLPVPVQRAMAVTWQGNPVVLGGWRTAGAQKVASAQVWRVVNAHWVELPHMLQPRAAAAAAVVGDRIIVTGGVDANGGMLNTTEIFDGNSWTLGAPIPTPRQMLAAASDGKLVYTVGGTNGNSDLATVEAYDPAAKTWTPLAGLPQARSDLGVAIADGRLVAVGGLSAGQVLKSVAVLDLMTKTWAGLPDMKTARHGMAVDAVGKSVYAIGGSTAVGDGQVIS